MKALIFLIFTVMLFGLAAHSDAQTNSRIITIQARLFVVDEDVYSTERKSIDDAVSRGDMNSLKSLAGIDFLLAPKVEVTDARKLKIQISNHKVSHPSAWDKVTNGQWTPAEFLTTDTGVEFEMTPTYSDGKILLSGICRVTDFDGSSDEKLEKVYTTFTKRETYFLEALNDGQTVGRRIPGTWIDHHDNPGGGPPHHSPQIAFFFLTAGLLDQSKEKASK